jgi:hypothetical protein
MVFGREHEIARASAVPEWLREFAEDALRRSADGSNPFQEIKNLFQRNKDLGAIEDRVRELKDRIGLSLLAEREAKADPVPVPAVKTAAVAGVPLGLGRLIRLANWLDELGLEDEAREIDDMIRVRAAKEKAKGVFDKFPKLQTFVDNVVRSRGGHVTVPAVLKMIRDERPDESSAASDEDLRKYVEDRIKEEKKDVNDASDNVAGFGVGLTTSWEDLQDDNKMFEPSKPAR